MKRCDHADVGGAVELLDFRMAVMEITENDGPPAGALQLTIHALSFGYNLVHEIVVTFDLGATGRPNLDEGELALVLRILLQKTLHAMEPFEDALCVIDAIDTHADIKRLRFELAKHLRLVSVERRHLGLGFGEHYADRERTNECQVATAIDGKAFPFHARFERTIDRLKEMIAVILHMKADEVCA